jgi:hypothetical protein
MQAAFVLWALMESKHRVWLQELLADDPSAGACAPSPAEVRRAFSSVHRTFISRPSFFLLEGTSLDTDDMRQCLADVILGGVPRDELGIDCDSRAAPWMCEYLTDWYALEQLRLHPGRVHSPDESSLHILGIAPTLSYYTSKLIEADKEGAFAVCATSVLRKPHEQRLRKVDLLIRKQIAQLPLNSSRMYLLVHAAWEWEALQPLVPLLRSIEAPSSRAQMRVAVVDPVFAYPSAWGYSSTQAIVTPYATSHLLEHLARQQQASVPDAASLTPTSRALKSDAQRNWTISFAGMLGRTSEGKLRGEVLRALVAGSSRANIASWTIDVAANAGPLQAVRQPQQGFASIVRANAERMTRSVFCPSPAGDTPTSRRYFEALAGGCVPVHLGEFAPMEGALPFQASVYWPSIMLFAGNMTCLAADGGRVAKSLGTWLDGVAAAHGRAVRQMSAHGQLMFVRHLSWAKGGGAMDSLLAEMHAHMRASRRRESSYS